MAEYKFILLSVLLQSTLVFGGVKEVLFGKQGGFNSITIGQRSTNPQDSELCNQIIVSDKQPFMLGYVDGTYCYPSADTLGDKPPIVITMFEAVDMLQGGQNRGEVFEKSGGVGKNQVCIYIKSQFGGSFKYKFKVYGYQQDNAPTGKGRSGFSRNSLK